MSDKKIAEYGSWSSPITSEIAVRLGGLPFPCLSEIHTCVDANNEGRKINLHGNVYKQHYYLFR